MAGDVDNKWSEDMFDSQTLFGSDAEATSDDLRDAATAAYVVTALLAPSDTAYDKGRGLAVGAATMVADGLLSRGIKDLAGRERPDGSNDSSLPSGHASKAASRSAMAIRNLGYIDMPPALRRTSTVALHTLALSTGAARVEAGKHHLSDVLVGYALGQFLATFMYEAFMPNYRSAAELSVTPLDQGAAITLSIPLR